MDFRNFAEFLQEISTWSSNEYGIEYIEWALNVFLTYDIDREFIEPFWRNLDSSIAILRFYRFFIGILTDPGFERFPKVVLSTFNIFSIIILLCGECE